MIFQDKINLIAVNLLSAFQSLGIFHTDNLRAVIQPEHSRVIPLKGNIRAGEILLHLAPLLIRHLRRIIQLAYIKAVKDIRTAVTIVCCKGCILRKIAVINRYGTIAQHTIKIHGILRKSHTPVPVYTAAILTEETPVHVLFCRFASQRILHTCNCRYVLLCLRI